MTHRDQQIRLALERCNALADEIISLRRDLKLAQDQLAAHEIELDQHDIEVRHIERDLVAHERLIDMVRPYMALTLWGRLRALVTGH